MLRVVVERDEDRAGVALFGDGDALVAEWVQSYADVRTYGDRPELLRSHDGHLATVVVDDVITVVRLANGEVAARGLAGRGIEASFPLGDGWTLDVSGEVSIDGGHTGHQGGSIGFYWAEEPRPSQAELDAWAARKRAELAAAASVSLHRRLLLRSGTRTVLVHEADVSPRDGGEVVLWPPVVGPAGVLLRHGFETDDGSQNDISPQFPWLVQPDGTVAQLPFELGVSPLLALPDGRWLLPGNDSLWRDDYDEPLSLLDATGQIEPLLVGGEPVPASRVLREAAPEVLAALPPVDPNQDVFWSTVSARLYADELLLVIEITHEDDTCTLIAAALPLTGATPARLIARIEATPGVQSAVAP